MTGNQIDKQLRSTCVADASTPIFCPVPTVVGTDPFMFTDTLPATAVLEEKDDALLRWYPMRIRYSRAKRTLAILDHLEDKGYETFLHMQQPENDWFSDGKVQPQPTLNNLLFVRAMKLQLKNLKRFDPTCMYMQFMSTPARTDDQRTKILWVPDAQMENFMSASLRPDPLSQRIPLTYNDFIDKQDRRVRILEGPFAGIVGEVKRIQRHRIVVALIRGANVAVGITHVPPESLELL